MSGLLGAGTADAVATAVDAALAAAAERAREATALLPPGPPPEWRGAVSASYAMHLDALRTRTAALAPQLEDARRLVLTIGRGGILG
ncbi:hypothetical protein [Arenivirga flava]|uniref:Uncharacterized protein n=1 Tax=Arenivirga flava TaxID=1930060 RepID=A0AA37UM21_9MICO|nr:hypothetical protein [Arenivirga flava]GMA28992.1 hypothetical protein GCM10025874_22450 [Arenivirga flava]